MPIKRLTEDAVLKFTKLSPEEKEKRGILGRLYGKVADFTNGTRNGRKYSEELWEKLFNSDLIKERFANGGVFGQLCHPDYEDVDMEKVACVMPEPPVKDKDGQLVAYVDILDTPCGKIAYQLAKYGYKLGISSRGSGDLITGPDGEEEVDPDTYTLSAFDLVEIPAVQSARLSFVESLDKKRYGKSLRQSLTESLDKATESDRKIMTESLNTLGINLNESTLVTKGDSLQDEEEYQIIDQGYDSISEKKLYKIMGKDGKERWIPESDAKFIIDKEFEPIPEVEEPVEEVHVDVPVEEPVIEEAVEMEESSSQELVDYYNKWKEANPDVDLKFLLDEYNGNLGSILYSETEFNKFVKWAKDEHSININPIPSEDFVDELGLEEEPAEEISAEEETVEEPVEEVVETESLNEEGEVATQLADMGQIPQNSEGLLMEAEEEEDNSFYVNESPYGFTEITYKGRIITYDDGTFTVDIDGDEAYEDSLEDAVKTVDELDLDPDYHIEHWHEEGDVKCATLDAVKTMLGLNESMYVKKKDNYKKVEEAKEEEAEKIDEALIESLANSNDEDYLRGRLHDLENDILTLAEEASYNGARKLSKILQSVLDLLDNRDNIIEESFDPRKVTQVLKLISDNIDVEMDENPEDMKHYLEQIVNFCQGLAEDYNVTLEPEKVDESVEDGSDIEVDTVESSGAVAGLKEALKKAKELNNDNLSLQEKLSASNARESQLEEELGRYKKATISLSKSAKETKTLKESLNKKDKESKDLTEKLTTVTSQSDETSKKLTESVEENKKLTEQLEQLTAKNDETAKQLAESKDLVEKYRRSYRSLKESFVEAKATYYGISKDAALKKLGESYKVSDVDKTLRELGTTKRNMGKLPVDLNESVKLSRANLSIKSHEKSLDDTSLDSLLSLLD